MIGSRNSLELDSVLAMTDAYFQTRLSATGARTEVWRHITKYLSRWILTDQPTLELGAGYADFSRYVDSPRRVAMDLAPQIVSFASVGVEAVVGDCTDLSQFPDGTFGTILASNFIEHLDRPQIQACLAEVFRTLQPGGRLILIQPNFRLNPGAYFDDYTHVSIFSDHSLRDLLVASGFSIAHVEPRFLPLTLKSKLSFGHKLVPLYLKLPYRPMAGQMLIVASKEH